MPIQTILKKIVLILRFDKILDLVLLAKAERLFQQNSQCQDARVWENATIFNLQNQRNKITIGKNSNIRGEIGIFPFGGEIQMGEYCYVGDYSKIWSFDKVTIGNHVLISHNVTIVDSNSHELDYLKRKESYTRLVENKRHNFNPADIESAPVVIEDHVWISFNAAILKGVTLGKGCIIAAGSVVTKDVEPFTIVAGNPARVVRKINQE